MTDYILLAAMAAVIVLTLFIRTNTAIVFLALCTGSVLLGASGTNASLLAWSLTSGISTSANFVQIALLLVPALVCAVMLRKHVSAGLMPLAFLPAAATAMLGVIFVTPLLSDGTEGTIVQTETWELLSQYQEPIVVIGLVTSVILIGLTVKKPHDKHHKKGKH